MAFPGAEFFVASPACQSAAAIAAASEFVVAASPAEYAVTEVAVAGLASGFTTDADEDVVFVAADLAVDLAVADFAA